MAARIASCTRSSRTIPSPPAGSGLLDTARGRRARQGRPAGPLADRGESVRAWVVRLMGDADQIGRARSAHVMGRRAKPRRVLWRGCTWAAMQRIPVGESLADRRRGLDGSPGLTCMCR